MKGYLISFLGLASYANAEKCYALVFSGAKEQAAFQAGAVQGLVGALNPGEVNYDAVSGVQGGAINAALFSSFDKGSEKDAAAKLVSFWQKAVKAKLYQSWWGGLTEGLLTEGGLYDNSPMKDFFTTEFENLFNKRDVFIGLTDVLSGNFKVLESEDVSDKQKLVDALQASFSFPGIFPPHEAFGSEFYDGTSIYNLDVFSAVNDCLEKTGGKEEDVVVDVVMTTKDYIEKVDASQYTSLSVLYRFMEISEYYGSLDGLLRAKFAYKNVNFRSIVMPSKPLTWNFTPLSLTEDQINAFIAQGKQDAEDALKNPLPVEDLMEFFALVRSRDESVKGMKFEEYLANKEQMPKADLSKLKFLQQ